MKNIFLIFFFCLFIIKNAFATNFILLTGSFFTDDEKEHPFFITSLDNGKSWTNNFLKNLNGKFNSISCSKKACVAVGEDENINAFIAVTTDKGVTWQYAVKIANLPQTMSMSRLTSVSCSNYTCIATGSYGDGTGYLKPLLLLSQNGGKDWNYPTIHLTLPNGIFSNANCHDNICIAVGSQVDVNKGKVTMLPFLAISQNNGITWHFPKEIYARRKLPVNFFDGSLETASCSNNICIASGGYNKDYTKPFIAMSQDGGNTWYYPKEIYSSALPPLTIGHLNNAASCSGKICIAIGIIDRDKDMREKPLLALTNDNGVTWSYPEQIYSAFSVKSDFDKAANCNGNLCIATGSYLQDPNNFINLPFVALTIDGGKNWTFPNDVSDPLKLPPLFKSLTLNEAICTETLCIAGGQYYTTQNDQLPLLLITTDSGTTWNYPAEIFRKENYPQMKRLMITAIAIH